MSMNETLIEKAKTLFRERFGGEPDFIVRAPGRVNLIGEHTDYNDGYVMPMAIEHAVYIALRANDDPSVTVYSADYEEVAEFALSDLNLNKRNAKDGWHGYVKGVAWSLQQSKYELLGWIGVIAGDVPRGAGLSSSAALELATARAFFCVSPNLNWNPAQIALAAQRAENQWVGVKTGIMDQMISAAGQKDHALLIDCRTLETMAAPLPTGTQVIIMDTNTRRELVTSAYNERREQCETAAAFFEAKALRDVTMDQLEAAHELLEPIVYRRARHVISENDRTLYASEAMRLNDPEILGRMMNASHVSMRDDFEITNDALNHIVECAQSVEGCYGARMTGGGFGGCAVALVDEKVVDTFLEVVSQGYKERTGLNATMYVSNASDGASVVYARELE